MSIPQALEKFSYIYVFPVLKSPYLLCLMLLKVIKKFLFVLLLNILSFL